METTFIMIKPDGVQRGLVGQIIARFEAKGYHLRALKMQNVPRELAEEHYADLSSKPFFGGLVEYILRWGKRGGIAARVPLGGVGGVGAARRRRTVANWRPCLRWRRPGRHPLFAVMLGPDRGAARRLRARRRRPAPPGAAAGRRDAGTLPAPPWCGRPARWSPDRRLLANHAARRAASRRPPAPAPAPAMHGHCWRWLL